MKKSDTLKLVTMAMLIAISVVLVLLVHFPIFPAVSFLEYDPADIPILIGSFFFGPLAAVVLTVVTALIQGFTVSAASGIYGIIMHIIATLALSVVSSAIYNSKARKDGGVSAKRTAVSLGAGVAAMVVVMFFANLVITPYFMGTTVSVVLGLMPFILLFNLIKAGANALISFALYKILSPVMKRFLALAA